MQRKNLIENILSLSAIQILNYLLPLITVPYVVRTIGAENYGLVNFSIAFGSYFILFLDYGFNFSATREVSLNKNSKEELEKIFSSVIAAKFVLFLLSSFLFWTIVLTIPLFVVHLSFYLIIYLSICAGMVTQFWFFQGLEELKHFSGLTFVIRVVVTLFVFTLVTKKEDSLLFLFLNSVGNFVIGAISLILIIYKYRIRFVVSSLRGITAQLKHGGVIFSSSIAINFYTTTNIFLLGLFTPAEIVGYYSGADKIRIAVQGLYSPISQAIYPYLSSLFAESFEKAISFLKKVFFIGGSIILLVCLVVFLESDLIVKILLGVGYEPAAELLRIMAFLPFIIFLSNIAGIQFLLNNGMSKEFARIVLVGACISLIVNGILTPTMLAKGTSITFLFTELFITACMFYPTYKKLRIKNPDARTN